MTRVDFYQLAAQSATAREHFACRLAEKAVSSGSKVLIATQSADMSESLDAMLWCFRPESFVPHTLSDDNTLDKRNKSNAASPVMISHLNDDNTHHDLLINLRDDLPAFFSRFARLAEIIIDHEAVLKTTRSHWQYCKTRGYPIHHHKIVS